MEDVLDQIERALARRGCSARRASIEAAGSPHLVRDLRRGSGTSVQKMRALCEVLDLEFYIGPRREFAALDDDRLVAAIEAFDRVCGDIELTMSVNRHDRARAIGAIYGLLLHADMPVERSPEFVRMQRVMESMLGLRRALLRLAEVSTVTDGEEGVGRRE